MRIATCSGHRRSSPLRLSGEMTVVVSLDEAGDVAQAAILRTARKLMDGEVFA